MFISVYNYICLMAFVRGPSTIVCLLSMPMGVDYAVIGFDMEVQP